MWSPSNCSDVHNPRQNHQTLERNHKATLLSLLRFFAHRFVQSIESLLYLFGRWHYVLYLKPLKDWLYFRVILQERSIDFRSRLFQFVATTILHTLLICIPLGSINAVASGKLNSLGRKINAHTNRHVLCDKNSVLLPALQREDNVPFDVHTFGCIILYTQSYILKMILPKIFREISFY